MKGGFIKQVSIGLLMASFAMACRPSVLNEIEIDSPTLFSVKVKIDEKRMRKRQLQVTIRDKNGNPVEFSNGRVIVNGEIASYGSQTVISTSRGYNYRIPSNTHEFQITIDWNPTDSYTFMVDQAAGFPGFENRMGWNIGKGRDRFIISPAPFRENRIVVEYDIMD